MAIFQISKIIVMKRLAKNFMIRAALCVLAVATLGGCGGYARTAGSSSGVEVYGTVDAGVVHESR
jgi:hypothetical protein